MARILFVQPSLNPPGGGSVVAAWMIQALRSEHTITLLGWTAPDLPRINRYAGTTLTQRDFAVRLVPALVRGLAARSPLPLWRVKNLYLMRRARDQRPDFDLVVTANNEGDYGLPTVQYVHYPTAHHWRPARDLRWYSRNPTVRRLYHTVAERTLGFDRARMVGSSTLVNSGYIAGLFEQLHGARPDVCYPPVAGEVPEVPWEGRQLAFACIGRFSGEKRLAEILDVIGAVRATHAAVALHILGSNDDPEITAFLRRRAQIAPEWIHLHEDLDRAALFDVVSRCRFGIHAMHHEHFGMAVAEMIRAGCVPFVHASGGPAEIVPFPELQFQSASDAVERIRRVLDDLALQQRLRAQLAARGAEFSTDRFAAHIRAAVDAALRGSVMPTQPGGDGDLARAG
ncbi:MAG: glycosyltransferase [Candidatus Binatia bacterium]